MEDSNSIEEYLFASKNNSYFAVDMSQLITDFISSSVTYDDDNKQLSEMPY